MLFHFGNVTGYASGTQKVDKDKVAWTQEHGQEIIIRKSDGAVLSFLLKFPDVILIPLDSMVEPSQIQNLLNVSCQTKNLDLP